MSQSAPPRILGRYALFDEVAAGGMATVHLGRLLGPVGFARTVAIKRLHAHFARDAEFVAMFLDEARLAARVHHPNVVSTIDVFQADGELFLVMDFIRGDTVSHLARAASVRGSTVPIDVATSVVAGTLYGLHAAHDAVNEHGEPLHIVHRDVSPQNVMLGTDGVPRVLDFGVAKASARLQSTRGGQLKGKLAYAAPEQLRGNVDRRTDVYAASVVLWELLTGRRLFDGENEAELVLRVISGCSTPPSAIVPTVPRALDDIVMCGLSLDPNARFATARDMAVALERAVRPATSRELGEWVETIAGDKLKARLRRVAEIESVSAVLPAGAAAASAPSHDPAAYAATVRATDVSPWSSSAPSQPSVPSAPSSPAATLSTVTAPGKHDDGKRILLGGVALVVAILVIGPIVAWRLASSQSPASPASVVSEAPAATSAPRVDASAAAPTPEPPPPPAASPSATQAPPAAKVDAKPAARAAPAKAAKGSCDPPFVYDANGVKRFKPECL